MAVEMPSTLGTETRHSIGRSIPDMVDNYRTDMHIHKQHNSIKSKANIPPCTSVANAAHYYYRDHSFLNMRVHHEQKE